MAGAGGVNNGQAVILNKVIEAGVIEKVTFDQRLEGDEDLSNADC